MKDFDDFLEYLRNNPTKKQTLEELPYKDFNSELYNEHELKMLEMVSKTTAITVRNILRRYHEWLQKTQ